MKSTTKRILILAFGIIAMGTTYSQVAKTQVLQLEAKTTPTGVLIEWPMNTSKTGTYRVYSRDQNAPSGNWDVASDPLIASQNTFDIAINGTYSQKEYMVVSLNSSNQTEAIGYIYPGNNHKSTIYKGQIILVIDSLISSKLPDDINTLKNDLYSSGWFVESFVVSRSDTPDKIKARIKQLYDSETYPKSALYLLGHVPVPYSGNFSSTGDRYPPDGHAEGSGNHTGAWPADVFYSDLSGVWEDGLVSCTTGKSERHHNVPGDGKYDASAIPGASVLETGRVDFYDLPAFSDDEVTLTQQYLQRVHDWKTGSIPYVNRALIDNNFNGLNLASSGYHNFPTFVGIDSTFDKRDYFESQNTDNYLWSYGCGAGSYTSCNGIGRTTDFALNKGKFNNIFTLLAGSYFGDWDSRNNLLRASLATGSLATCWAGIPKWYLHHMGLGMNIGYGAIITQNNNLGYFNGSFNGSAKGIHIALLGDPTLTLNPITPVTNVKAESIDGSVHLSWDNIANAEQYNVFRIDTMEKKMVWVNGPGSACETTITQNNFTDECNWSSGNYIYGVSASSMVSTGSGSYLSHSMMSFADIQHTNSKGQPLMDLSVYPNPSKGTLRINGIKGTFTLEVYDVYGKTRLIKEGLEANSELELNELSDGFYWLRLQSKNGESKHSLIISK